MKAALLNEFGGIPVVQDVAEPVRATGETLVRVSAATVGHLDLTVASGQFGIRPDLPHTGGTDAAGVVVESDTFEPGQRVFVRGGGLGLTRKGCWAELVTVRDPNVIRYRTELPAHLAASFLLPASTAYVAIHDIARMRSGERVIVGGAAGAVGAMAAQFALAAGASEVLGIVSRPESRMRVPRGVKPVTVSELAGVEAGWDMLVDTLGGKALKSALALIRTGGRAALIGYTLGTELVLDLPNWMLADVALLPVNMIPRGARQTELFEPLAEQLAAGTLELPVETHPMSDIGQVVQRLAEGRSHGRVVVLPENH